MFLLSKEKGKTSEFYSNGFKNKEVGRFGGP